MLRKDDIVKLSKITGLRPHQQEKAYIQTLVLRSVFSHSDPVFKGGTSLMMVHGLNRFSEDLDFTCGEKDTLEGLSKSIKDDLSAIGIESIIKKNPTLENSASFRIGARGPLFTKERERCFVNCDFSLREKVIGEPEARFIDPTYPDILPFSVRVMDPAEIAAEKVRAIMTRDKARDVFDLGFLISKGILPTQRLIDNKMALYSMNFSLEEFKTALSRKEDLWRIELTPFIIGKLNDFDKESSKIIEALSSVDG
jgi:predicted nucleotidyltransferase component of viral defense system